MDLGQCLQSTSDRKCQYRPALTITKKYFLSIRFRDIENQISNFQSVKINYLDILEYVIMNLCNWSKLDTNILLLPTFRFHSYLTYINKLI